MIEPVDRDCPMSENRTFTWAARSKEGTRCPNCGANAWYSESYGFRSGNWISSTGSQPWFEVLTNKRRLEYVFIDTCAECETVVT